MRDRVVYCGHEISVDVLRKTPDKIEAVMDTLIPQNVKELHAFLGLVNYYHKNYAQIQKEALGIVWGVKNPLLSCTKEN